MARLSRGRLRSFLRRHAAALAVAATLATLPATGRADPISITAALAPSIGGAAAAFIANAAAFLAANSWVIGIGLNLLGASQARRKQRKAAAAARAAYNASLQDRNVTILSAEAPRAVIYGSPAPIGGAIVAMFTSGSRDQYKHIVLVLAAHELESIDEVYIEGEAVGLASRDASDWMTTSPFAKTEAINYSELVTFSAGGSATLTKTPMESSVISAREFGTEEYVAVTITASSTTITGPANVSCYVHYRYNLTTSYLRIAPHLGADTLADSYLISAVPTKWTADHKLSGYAYLSITLDLTFDRFQGGPPNITAKVKGKKVQDPRLGLNYLPYSQEIDNAAWTKSEATIIANAASGPGSLGVNLLTYSANFSNAAWGKTSVTLTDNDAIGPFGQMTATRMTSTVTGILSQSATKAASVMAYTGSLYVKNNTVTNNLTISVDDGTATNRGRIVIDSSGNITSTANDGTFTATVGSKTAEANGWTRYVITTVTSTGTNLRLRFFYTGDAAKYLWIDGAQLEPGHYATPYRASTTAAVGSATADKLVPSAVSTTHFFNRTALTGANAPAIGDWFTASIRARLAESDYPYLRIALTTAVFASGSAYFHLGTGVVSDVGSGSSASMVDEGNGWWRCSLTAQCTTAGNAAAIFFNYQAVGTSFAGDALKGIYVTDPQLEPGTVAGAVVTTTASARTSTASPTYSRNPALICADFLQSAEGFGASAAQIDQAALIAAANACDQAVYTSSDSTGNSTALFVLDGVFTTDADREGTLQALEDAMSGNCHQSGGVWRVMAGTWASPVMDLTDADCAAPIQITQASYSAKDRFNGVRGQYVDASRLGVPEDYTPYQNSTFLTADGVERWASINYPHTGSIQRCQHLARLHVERSRGGLVIQYPAHLRAWPLQPGDRVTVTNAEFGWARKTFRVTDWVFSPSTPLALEMVEDAASVWDLADETSLSALPNSSLPDPWTVETLAGLAAYSGTDELLVQGDGSIITRVRLAWTQASGRYVLANGRVQLRYKRVITTDDVWTVLELPGDETTVTLSSLADGAGYIFSARFVANNGAKGAWAYLDHLVVGKSEPPDNFDVFTIAAQPDGTRQFDFYYTTTTRPVDLAGAEIRYIEGFPSTPAWDDMTPLNNDGFYTQSPVETNQLLEGDWTFAIRARDTTGNLSTALVYATATLPDRRVGTTLKEWDEAEEGFTGTKTSCSVVGGILEADDTTTAWTTPASWAAFTSWKPSPASPITYITPARDLGAIVSGQISSTIDADGTVVTEISTSDDGSTYSAYGSAATPFTARYFKLRLTITATGPDPVPAVRTWVYSVSGEPIREILNDIDITTLGGGYLGTGDARAPITASYSVITRATVAAIQDGSAASWTWQLVDRNTSGPRFKFYENGALSDPALVDFYIEGY